MRRNITSDSLIEMIKFARITALPEKAKEDKEWSKAIVLIERKNGSTDYAVAHHDYFSIDGIRIVKEMGGVGAYNKLLEVFPYRYLSFKSTPVVNTKKDILSFIASVYNRPAAFYESMDKEEIHKYFQQACIKSDLMLANQLRSVDHYQLGKFSAEEGLNPTKTVNKEKNNTKKEQDEETTEAAISEQEGDDEDF